MDGRARSCGAPRQRLTGVASAELSHDERANLGDPLEVAVHVYDAELVVQRSLRDEEVGDGCPMPHPAMMRKVALEPQRSLEDVRRRGDRIEARVQLLAKRVVVGSRASGVEL